MYPCSEPGLSKAFCLLNKNVVNTSYIFNIFLKVVEKKTMKILSRNCNLATLKFQRSRFSLPPSPKGNIPNFWVSFYPIGRIRCRISAKNLECQSFTCLNQFVYVKVIFLSHNAESLCRDVFCITYGF